MQWIKYISPSQIFQFVLKTTNVLEFKQIVETPPVLNTKVIITHFEEQSNNNAIIWIEFSVPKDNSIVIGTYIASIKKDDIQLIEYYGLHYIQSS